MCKVMACLASVLVLCLVSTSAFGAITVLEIPVAADYYDLEEHLDDGRLDFFSTDLEFPYEDGLGTDPVSDPQLVGLFFTNVDIAPGTTILNAQVRFDVDNVDKNPGAVNVLIQGELAGSYPIAPFGLSGRNMTDPVKWSPDVWDVKHVKKFTPDISAIIQQIIDQPEWASGGTIGLIISDDPDNPSVGIREAESFRDNATSNQDRIPTLLITIPEPASMVLLGVGALGLLRRKKR